MQSHIKQLFFSHIKTAEILLPTVTYFSTINSILFKCFHPDYTISHFNLYIFCKYPSFCWLQMWLQFL